MTPRPYLSVVCWTRNDGYTSNHEARLLHAIGFLQRQLDRHRIPSEIVVVDWNPPTDRPLLSEVLNALPEAPYVTLRLVSVDARFHQRARGWQHRGMHPSNAANVGIRRARGQFIQPKAIDTFYTEALVAHIARQALDPSCVYRCDRVDVRPPEDVDWMRLPDDALLAELGRHVAVRNGRLSHSIDWQIRDLHTNACGDFMPMSNKMWQRIRGFPEDPTVLCLDGDSIALHAAAAHGAREVCLPDDCHIYKILHGNTHLQRMSVIWKDWQLRLDRRLVETNRRRLAANLRIWLDYPRRRVRGVEDILAPSIERNFVAKATRYARGDTTIATNDAGWGLGREDLPETILSRGNWEQPMQAIA